MVTTPVRACQNKTPPSQWDGGSAVPPTFPPRLGSPIDAGPAPGTADDSLRDHGRVRPAYPRAHTGRSGPRVSAWRLKGGVQPGVRAGLTAWAPPLFRSAVPAYSSPSSPNDHHCTMAGRTVGTEKPRLLNGPDGQGVLRTAPNVPAFRRHLISQGGVAW